MARLPRWAGPILLIVAGGLFLILLPWSASTLSIRYGWMGERPSFWNFTSLALVVAGFALVVWCFSLHFVHAPRGWQLGEMVPTYLLTSGPYRFTRNPMYLGYCAIWLGWTLFYGSITVLIGLVIFWTLFALFLVPWEERRLEARFGHTYARYRNRVPRWIPRLH